MKFAPGGSVVYAHARIQFYCATLFIGLLLDLPLISCNLLVEQSEMRCASFGGDRCPWRLVAPVHWTTVPYQGSTYEPHGRHIDRVVIGSMELAGHYQRCEAWFRSVLLLWIAGDWGVERLRFLCFELLFLIQNSHHFLCHYQWFWWWYRSYLERESRLAGMSI